MAKRAKRAKTETLALPVAGRVAIGVMAAAALGYALLSRPTSVQPTKRSTAHQALALSAPAPARTPTPVHIPVPVPVAAPISTPAPRVETPKSAVAPARLDRQVVDYVSHQTPGTVVIDTENTFLYLVLNDGQALRYGIGVGREGFTWSGEQTVARKTAWPDWRPPAEMISRQPYLPRFMAGGPGNPLGARAMYLGETEFRIHGTNKPDTIGKRVSSGCIRLTNEDVTDLYDRVKVGAKVIVLPNRPLATNAQPSSSGPKLAEAQ